MGRSAGPWWAEGHVWDFSIKTYPAHGFTPWKNDIYMYLYMEISPININQRRKYLMVNERECMAWRRFFSVKSWRISPIVDSWRGDFILIYQAWSSPFYLDDGQGKSVIPCTCWLGMAADYSPTYLIGDCDLIHNWVDTYEPTSRIGMGLD